MMSDSTINIVSDPESDNSSSMGIWEKVISLSDDFDSERVSGNSLDEKAYSFYDFESLLLDDVKWEIILRFLFPTHFLTKKEIQVIKQMRERADDFIQLYL